jgi:hypothetical protein
MNDLKERILKAWNDTELYFLEPWGKSFLDNFPLCNLIEKENNLPCKLCNFYIINNLHLCPLFNKDAFIHCEHLKVFDNANVALYNLLTKYHKTTYKEFQERRYLSKEICPVVIQEFVDVVKFLCENYFILEKLDDEIFEKNETFKYLVGVK